jgi:hypothetical protein
LPNAVKDSKAICNALIPKYRVKLHEEILENFTRDIINDSFKNLQFNPNDSLLIVYNGHAELDDSKTLYWIPEQGRRDDTTTWFNTSHIFNFIGRLDINHVALIVNCCNSGDMHAQQSIRSTKSKGTRFLLTAGKENQSVPDTSETSE